MHAVGDQFGVNVLKEQRGPGGSRFAVMQAEHAVEGMREAVGAIFDRFGAFIKFRSGMPHRDFDALGNTVADQRVIVIFFRRDADHLDLTFSRLLVTVKLFNVGFLN